MSVKVASRLALLVVLGLLEPGCAKEMADKTDQSEARRIESVLKRHNDMLLSLPGVVGTAIGSCEGRPCIRVLVVKKTPELLSKIPQKLDGFQVVTVETGEIRAL